MFGLKKTIHVVLFVETKPHEFLRPNIRFTRTNRHDVNSLTVSKSGCMYISAVHFCSTRRVMKMGLVGSGAAELYVLVLPYHQHISIFVSVCTASLTAEDILTKIQCLTLT